MEVVDEAFDEPWPDDQKVDMALILKIATFGILAAALIWIALGVIRFFMVASYGNG